MRTKNGQRIRRLWENNYRRSLEITLLLLTADGICFEGTSAPASSTNRNEAKLRRVQAHDWRVEAENRKRAYPLGHIPEGARARALAQIEAAEAS